MFSVGDYVIYGYEGVCRIDEVGRLNVPGLDKNREYYRLTSHYRKGTIYAPVDGKIVLRPVISRDELERLLPTLRELQPFADAPTDPRHAAAYYREILAKHNCLCLLRLCKTLYEKQKLLESAHKTVSSTDLRGWKTAEEMIHGEFAFVLGIEPSAVPAHLAQYL